MAAKEIVVDKYFEDYIKNSMRTESGAPTELNVNKDILINLFSMFIEMTEILDGIKKAVFYNKDTKYTTELYERIAKIQKHASAVSSPIFDEKNKRTKGDVIKNIDVRVFHGILGIMTEAGELAEVINKSLKDVNVLVDDVNVHEEIHDISWYEAILHDAINKSWRKGMENNTEKLRVRFPEKFTDELAANRNLEAERETLEKS